MQEETGRPKEVLLGSDYFSHLNLGSSENEVNELLSSEDWELFRTQAEQTSYYAEFGAGLSTFYVALQENTKLVVTSETDHKWVKRIISAGGPVQEKISIKFVDFGPVQKWGRPQSYTKINNVWRYSAAPFGAGFMPDLILIDGRFRVHCFLEALLRARKGTKIIFDDYVNRPWYHVVERFISPKQTSGRQALFEVNTRYLDRRVIKKLSKQFSYVMD